MPSPLKLTNNSIGQLAGNVSDAATSLSLQAGEGVLFPIIVGGEFFPVTAIRSSDGEIEIMKVTARSGDDLTVTRAQEDTSALEFFAGDRIELRLTAGTFSDETARVEGKADAAQSTADAAVPIDGDVTINNVKTFDQSPIVPADFKWQCIPIGGYVEIDDSITGVEIPPIDDPLFRYIKLTAGLTGVGAYNEGCLTSESVSGSAPQVLATAVVNLAGSPMLGQTIDLLNTEERVLRAGVAAGTKLQDALQNITGSLGFRGEIINTSTGAFLKEVDAAGNRADGTFTTTTLLSFDASRVARTSTETRAKSLTITVYQRIF